MSEILKLANRFEKLLKVAGPGVSLQLADAQDILAKAVGVVIDGGSATINTNAPIIKDINTMMDQANLQSLKANINIAPNKVVTFTTTDPQVTKMLNTKYSGLCTKLLAADKRVPTDGLVWTDWVSY